MQGCVFCYLGKNAPSIWHPLDLSDDCVAAIGACVFRCAASAAHFLFGVRAMRAKCFLFGHSQAPYHLQEMIDRAVNDFYELGFRVFVVGYHGAFDQMATSALRRLKERHSDIFLFVLTPYHPAEREIPIPEGFDTSFYPPEMEYVPRKFCIARANEFMIRRSEGVICYARHPGNARNLYEKINQKKVFVRNIAWEEAHKENPEFLHPDAEKIVHNNG